MEFPKIEVRFQNLTVEAYVHTGSRALPTIPNFIFNMSEVHGGPTTIAAIALLLIVQYFSLSISSDFI